MKVDGDVGGADGAAGGQAHPHAARELIAGEQLQAAALRASQVCGMRVWGRLTCGDEASGCEGFGAGCWRPSGVNRMKQHWARSTVGKQLRWGQCYLPFTRTHHEAHFPVPVGGRLGHVDQQPARRTTVRSGGRAERIRHLST